MAVSINYPLISWPKSDDITFNGIYGKSMYKPNHASNWCVPDTEELFHQHMADKEKSSILKSLDWSKDSIIYKFNNHGFRSNDDWDLFSSEPGNMFLGCSFTLGIGLNIEDTWSYKVSSQLGGKFYNLAQSGTGIETQYRMLKAWGPLLKPRRIFTIGSFEPRREFFTHRIRPTVIGWWSQGHCAQHIMSVISPKEEIDITIFRCLDAMISIATRINAELWCARPDDVMLADISADAASARDLMHKGPLWHSTLASTVGNWERLA
jgi:hypothetical protein